MKDSSEQKFSSVKENVVLHSDKLKRDQKEVINIPLKACNR